MYLTPGFRRKLHVPEPSPEALIGRDPWPGSVLIPPVMEPPLLGRRIPHPDVLTAEERALTLFVAYRRACLSYFKGEKLSGTDAPTAHTDKWYDAVRATGYSSVMLWALTVARHYHRNNKNKSAVPSVRQVFGRWATERAEEWRSESLDVASEWHGRLFYDSLLVRKLRELWAEHNRQGFSPVRIPNYEERILRCNERHRTLQAYWHQQVIEKPHYNALDDLPLEAL